MTTTPRTDAAFEGDLSVGIPPEIKTWEEAKKFARKLETELNELKVELEKAKAQRNKAALEERQIYIPQLIKLREERDQLLTTDKELRKTLSNLVEAVINSGACEQSYNVDKAIEEAQEELERTKPA